MTLRTLLVKLGFKGDITKLAKFDDKITGLKTNVLGLSAVFASLTATVGYFLNEAAKLEQTKIAFEVMTNSVEMGQKLVKDLFTFARTTPFRIPGVLQASKILLAMGVTAGEQIDTLTKLGHVAAGIGKPLDQLASIFGRVRAAGYLTGYEMERLRRAGVPLGAYLSELLKKPEREILHLIRSKQISFEMFAEAWELMVEKRFPKLMDKLLLTFKGIVSNIQDYIYEIVAFSGEKLLPVFKLMANQLMFLLDSSRELIGLKFKQFFSGVSTALELMNKGFIKLYFRTRETITQFGGINKLFKIFVTLFGLFAGVKSLALLGRLGKIVISLLSFASLKLTLIGIAMIGIFLATEDILGFILGKKSALESILNLIEKKAPNAYKYLIKWLRVLRKEIEGLTLLSIGLFEGLTTGDWTMAKAGAEQVSEAWRMAFEKVKKTRDEKSRISGRGIGYRSEEFLEGMNVIERQIAKSPFLIKISESIEKLKYIVDDAFKPAGKHIPITIGPQFTKNIIPQLSIDPTVTMYKHARESIQKESPVQKILDRSEKLKTGLKDININIPLEVHFNDLPTNVNNERVINEIKNTIKTVAKETLSDTLKTELSAVEPPQI